MRVLKDAFNLSEHDRLDHCRTNQLANEIGSFQRDFAEKPSPSCILFRI